MRRSLPLFFSLSLVFLVLGCGGDESNSDSSAGASDVQAQPGKVQDVEPEPVPELTLETMDGESVALGEQDERVLLVNFWATWCAPCREEIPELKALHSNLQSEGLTVLGIALDREGKEVVEPFAEKLSINYPIVVDAEGETESEFGPIYGLPTTIVVENGQITQRVIGVFPVDEMRPELKNMLAEGGSASQQS